MRIRAPFYGSLAVLLSACTVVGPNYELPEQAKINAPGAQQDFQGRDPAFTADGEAPGDWWQLYSDAQLNQLVQEALAANTDLRMAAANLARSEAVSMEVEGAKHVKLSASATAVHARESGEAYLVPERLPVENLADAGINIAYQIDLVGGLKRAAEAAAADVEASHAALNLARISIVADLVFSYTEACAAGHELEVAQRSLELQQQNQAVVARLVSYGRS
ncbi:MAG: TolC family protein, partial [Azovibrio sp.]